MLGQDDILNSCLTLIEENKFPVFTILVGKKGSGKKLLANTIAPKLGKYTLHIDSRVFSVREMINTAYQVKDSTVFIVDDADNMSVIAKNTLLKITEEPPANVHIIMTLVDEQNTLPTIRSRANVIKMNNYSQEDLINFYNNCSEILDKPSSNIQYIKQFCETPGDVIQLCSFNMKEFNEYIDLVIENIASVQLANSFKISSKIALNDEEDKYPLSLFFKAFSTKCLERFKDDPYRYGTGVKVTSKYSQELSNISLSKQNIFDMWLLAIRNYWGAKECKE